MRGSVERKEESRESLEEGKGMEKALEGGLEGHVGGTGGRAEGGSPTGRKAKSLLDLGFTSSLPSNNICFGAQRKRKKCKDQKSYCQLELGHPLESTKMSDMIVRKGRRRVTVKSTVL